MKKINQKELDSELQSIREMSHWSDQSDQLFFRKGQVIYFEGSSSLGIFIIAKGRVKITQNASNGREFVTQIASRGELLGHESLFNHLRHINSAIALEDTILTFIHKKDFLLQLREEESLLEEILSQLCLQTCEIEQKAAKIAYKPVRGRLAEALLFLDKRFNDTEKQHHYLSISRGDLAGLIGSVKETVIRLLSEFKNEGLVQTEGTRIELMEPEQLKAISEMYD